VPWILTWQPSGKPGDPLTTEDRRREALSREINRDAEALARRLHEDELSDDGDDADGAVAVRH
jgi:hypothetical protein